MFCITDLSSDTVGLRSWTELPRGLKTANNETAQVCPVLSKDIQWFDLAACTASGSRHRQSPPEIKAVKFTFCTLDPRHHLNPAPHLMIATPLAFSIAKRITQYPRT